MPIPKPGRDHRLEKNYRPISLLLIVSTLLESMVHRRLYVWAEKNSHIAGYRAYSNSVHLLIRLTHQVFAVRFDGDIFALHVIARAYEERSVPGIVFSFQIDAIELCDRARRSKLTFELVYRKAQSGLSPLLFILFISECSDLLHCAHAEYAYDIIQWYSHSWPHIIKAMLNETSGQ